MSLISSDMLGLIAPAFFAGLIVAATHVPLGQEVLKRGIIFIDLAIAQIAALGVVISHTIFHIEEGVFPLITALFFALLGGALFSWLGKRTPKYQEPFIGCAFVMSASLIILLLAGDPHGGEEMQDLLAGQILWVGWAQIALTAVVYALVLLLWFRFKARRSFLFYGLFPITITLSVQLVGVYLVFASLIIPALTAVSFPKKYNLVIGYGAAILAVLCGLIISVLADFPAGPALVCAYAISGGVIYFTNKNWKKYITFHKDIVGRIKE